jgi:hypothetical protein
VTRSLIANQGLDLPSHRPADWPGGERGDQMWQCLRLHLWGLSYAEMGRRAGVSPERIRTVVYQSLAECRRRGILR